MKASPVPLGRLRLLLLPLVLLGLAGPVCGDSVLDSKHNLSVSGPGTIKAVAEREVCIFCHAPHRAGTERPLWNHRMSSATYVPYQSPSMDATVGQPTGASKLCLSCHDGTVAIGMVNSRPQPIPMEGDVTYMPSGPNNLGTDLSQHHPVSFTYDAALAAKDGHLRDPSSLTQEVRLDHNNQMQCTACHDPHDDQYGKFLVLPSSGTELCTACHDDSLSASSSHSNSNAPLVGRATTLAAGSQDAARKTDGRRSSKKTNTRVPKTVSENGCNNCHLPHGAGGRRQLLRTVREEETCFVCHNGSVVRQNIEAEFNKFSVHPVRQTSTLHRGGEDILNGSRHVACSDCHNSHAAKETEVAAPRAAGALLGVSGVNRGGSVVDPVKNEYELCFRCHGDNTGRTKPSADRTTSETNTREAFNPANRSFHPVIEPGKSRNVPSLLPPYTAGSIIRCTDCHNNDQGPGAGGSGPAGPHGSAFEPLLERQLITTDQIGESAANYAMCYKCHSRDSILSDQSFRATNAVGMDRGHRFHVVDQKAACTTCHDSHGVAENAHLISFNPEYVTAGAGERASYESRGLFRGTCTLTCHGTIHDDVSYPDSMSGPTTKRTPGPKVRKGQKR